MNRAISSRCTTFGELPLTELAKLVEHDRKTVRKRLEAARRRLSVLMQADQWPVETAHGAPVTGPRPPSLEPRLSDELEVVCVTPGLRVGLVGNVVVTIWPRGAELVSVETLASVGPALVDRCGGKVAYLASVEDVVHLPELPARKLIVELLERWGPSFLAYATVMAGKGAWIVRPIMSGLLVLTRPRFPMQFFKSVPDASGWLCARYAMGAEGHLPERTLTAAVEHLRALTR